MRAVVGEDPQRHAAFFEPVENGQGIGKETIEVVGFEHLPHIFGRLRAMRKQFLEDGQPPTIDAGIIFTQTDGLVAA